MDAVALQRIRAKAKQIDNDPLSFYTLGVPRLREALSLYTADEPVSELLLRACNKGGKSLVQAAFGIACARKMPSFDGVRLPQWIGKVEVAQLVLDYKQMLLSIQPAYERMLGGWPHKIIRRGQNFEAIFVKPHVGGGDDPNGWPAIHFLSQKNLTTGVGLRGDVILFDEPPVPSILDELRKAGHAGRRSIRMIGMTPIIRRQWAPIKEQYGDPPRMSLTRPNRYWAECRWSLGEIPDWILSEEEKEELRFNYSKVPSLIGAREHGDYCNTDGSCPFHVPTLEKLLAEATDPILQPCRVQRENPDGTLGESFILDLEVWAKPQIGKTYWIVIDPASGTDDGHGHHDPLGLLVLERGTGNLVARWNGYASPFSVGVLGAIVARQYNNAVVDVESADRWGVGVFDGLHASKYGNRAKELRQLREGEWVEDLGFKNTAQTRPQIIAAVQAWVDARRSGVKYGNCPSRKVIECLLDCILDEAGKIVGAPGIHDEDLILWGEGLRRTVKLGGRMIPEIQPKEHSWEEQMIAKINQKAKPPQEVPTIGKAKRPPSV